MIISDEDFHSLVLVISISAFKNKLDCAEEILHSCRYGIRAQGWRVFFPTWNHVAPIPSRYRFRSCNVLNRLVDFRSRSGLPPPFAGWPALSF